MKFNESGKFEDMSPKGKANLIRGAVGGHEEPDGDEGEPIGGDLQRMEIEPADNGGFTVTHHMKSKPSKKKNEPSHYEEPKKHVFSSHAEMIHHVSKNTKR